MKTKYLCFLIVGIGLLFPCNLLAAGEEVKIATHQGDHRLSITTTPFIQCALEMIDQPYSITKVPWARAQMGTEEGVYDAFFSAAQNAKRGLYAVFSPSIFSIKWFYVVNKDSGISPDDTDFNSKKFSANLGSARLTWLKVKQSKGEIQKKVIEVDTSDQAMRMLAANRIDVVLMNGHGLENSLTALSMDRNDIKTFLVHELPSGIYFSKEFSERNPGFLERFNGALLKCNSRLRTEKVQ